MSLFKKRHAAAGECRQHAVELASASPRRGGLWRTVSVALAGLAVCACGPLDDGSSGGGSGASPPAMDMHDTMTWVLDPAADVIWGSAGFVLTAEGETPLAPTTDEGWAQVRHGAAVVAAGGDLLLLPGLKPEADAAAWVEFAQGMKRIGLQAVEAVDARDSDALFETGGHLYNVCLACHQLYAREPADDG